jgi:hypothetical protein
MTKRAFDKIAGGLREALSVAKGESEPAGITSVARLSIIFSPREDGGLRVYSDQIPGFVLSHNNPAAVLLDVAPALWTILNWPYPAAQEADAPA